MSSILANTCWPSRFWLKWFLLFFFTAVVGAVLAAFTRPRPVVKDDGVAPPTIQALIEVRDSTGRLVAARVYLAKSREEMDEGKSFPVSRTAQAAKSQNAGLLYDFMVQPLDDKGNRIGDPEPFRITWPKTDREVVTFKLTRRIGEGGVKPLNTNGQTGANSAGNGHGGGVSHDPFGTGNGTKPEGGQENTKGEENFDWLSRRAVTDADLAGKSKDDLRIMRNWIAARHGHVFKSPDLQEYFKHFDWYKPGSETQPSALESQNAVKIQQRENQAH